MTDQWLQRVYPGLSEEQRWIAYGRDLVEAEEIANGDAIPDRIDRNSLEAREHFQRLSELHVDPHTYESFNQDSAVDNVMVMSNCSRDIAVRVLVHCNGDVMQALMMIEP